MQGKLFSYKTIPENYENDLLNKILVHSSKHYNYEQTLFVLYISDGRNLKYFRALGTVSARRCDRQDHQ
jgi:hypothetical protein